MFSKVALFAAASMAVFVAAAPTSSGGINNSCNTGSMQCCHSVQSSNSPAAQGLIANLLGVQAGDVTGMVGLTCTSVTAIGLGGNSCTAQPTCCSGNNYNGLLVLGCSPVNLNA